MTPQEQQTVISDPRIKELRQKYNELIRRKNGLIMEISNVEADIIKNMGQFEAIAKAILGVVAPSTPEPCACGKEECANGCQKQADVPVPAPAETPAEGNKDGQPS